MPPDATDPFDIQPHHATPIYRQVVEQVQRLVAGGQLRAGAELPSVRAVAQAAVQRWVRQDLNRLAWGHTESA